MILSHLIRNANIRQRVLLLTLLPTLLATFLLAWALTDQRLEDAQQDMLNEGFVMLDYLATGAEYGMLSSNNNALASIAKTALKNPIVSNVTFLDSEGTPLFGQQQPPFEQLQQWQQPGYISDDHHWLLYQPIKLSGLTVDDYQSINETTAPQLGWVLLKINDQQLSKEKAAIFMLTLKITTGVLAMGLWLAWLIGRTLTRPINQISSTVQRLQTNQLDARADVEVGGELGELAAGINQLAEKVQHTQANLEFEVNDATQELKMAMQALELQNKQLDKARAEAETANQTKDEFLARMSHELRTPLTSVIGFSDLLEKTPLDNTQHDYLQVTKQASQLLLCLIDDLLDFSKLSSDAITLEQISFNFEACVEQALDMHLASARQKGIDLYFIPDPGLPMSVKGDPTRISQVLSNLISNAMKFTQQGQVVVSLKSERRGQWVYINLEVSDTGIGISQAQQQNLFKPFAQADATISRRFGGSGLGLVICQRLVELMGGSLQLDSLEGVGTQVHLELPLRVVTERPQPPVFNQLKVLLYDQEPVSQQSLRRRLEYLGCSVTCADNYQQLEQRVKQQGDASPQCLLVNLSQQQLSAVEQASWDNLLQLQLQAPIVLISSLDDHELRQRLPQAWAGAADLRLLQKPFSSQSLIQALSPSASTDSQAANHQPSIALDGLTVLVAEDNRFNQQLIKRMLELQGAQVRLANNGEEALRCINEEPVDLVVMDLHMPDMDGLATSAAIRELPGPEAGLPIIVLTASPLDTYRQQFNRLKIDAALNKPLDESILISTISRICDLEPAAQINQSASATRLRRYGIEDHALHTELQQQLAALEQAHDDGNSLLMRDHTHQLMGLAGLLGLEELDQAAKALNHAVKTAQAEAINDALQLLAQQIKEALSQPANS